MDDKRFDGLTRLFGSGASRRTILKGLFGIGGATVAGATARDAVDARPIGSRPTIPPPPPPTITTTTTTAAPCPAGQQQCPNSTLCCPAGACARSGNRAICCDGTLGNGDVVCGLDCCDTDDQCCDGECCPDETVCLARVFGEGPFVEEEVCCPVAQTCRTAGGDGICCDGACFDPEGGVAPAQVLNPDFVCCPAGGTVCEGGDETLCCTGETPQCCLRGSTQTPLCLPADACCEDCPGACDACNPETNTCEDVDALCTGACEVCYQGQCVSECTGGEVCCERTVQGVPIEPFCIDPLTQCCVNADCFDPPFNFDRGCVACPASGPNAFTCDPRNEGEPCSGAGECDVCYQGQCLETPCPTTSTTTTTTTTAAPTTTTTTAEPTTTTAAPTTTTTVAPTTTTTAGPCTEPDFACGAVCCPSESYEFCCGGVENECCGFDSGNEFTRQCNANGHCCELGEEACDGVCVPLGTCPTTTTAEPTTTTTAVLTTTTTTVAPTTTAAPTTTTTTTTTQDPSLCLAIAALCDVVDNRCCEGLGCFRPLQGAQGDAVCALCLEEDQRCQDDSNCCPGLVCSFGNCLAAECREDSDCDLCEVCSDNFNCVDGEPGSSCGPCLTCQTVDFGGFTEFGCFAVENGTSDPLCPNAEGAICCDGACAATESCACSDQTQCPACFRCESETCVFDCRLRDETGPCCAGCQTCDDDEVFGSGFCFDNDDRCPGGRCTGCIDGVCGDVDNRCNECERCDQGQCVFDCNRRDEDFSCCDEGTCGRSFCRADGTCVISEDPNEFCGACRECVFDESQNEFNCRNVPNGSTDPTGTCEAGQICCDGVCATVGDCDCTVDADCGPCLSCFNGSCIADCTRSAGAGPCCAGCQFCEAETGRCEDDSDLCGECGDCDGGVCRDDDLDCDDCERCIEGVCVFNCNNEEGAADCCEDTGSCGVADACVEGACTYLPNEALCPGLCLTCVATSSGGAFNCQTDPTCGCAADDGCGPCGTCDEATDTCVVIASGAPRPGFSGLCCDGTHFSEGECCTDQFCLDTYGEFLAVCNPFHFCEICREDQTCLDIFGSDLPFCDPRSNRCVECRETAHCDDGNPCTIVECIDSRFCEGASLGIGTLVDGGICCAAPDFDIAFFANGNCCSDADCAGGQICCSHVCQAGPACTCTDVDNCGPCATCNGTTCVAVPGTEPREGFFGICCDGTFIPDGDCCDDEHCCDGGTFSNGQCCFGDECFPSICRVHDCVECVNDANCDEGDLCRSVFCDDENDCDGISVPDGPIAGGTARCCDGDFFESADCCVDADCAGTPLTPVCAFTNQAGTLVCAECRDHVHCDDGNPCTVDICNFDDGTCVFDPIIEGFNPEGAGFCCTGVLQSDACPTTTSTTTTEGPTTTTTEGPTTTTTDPLLCEDPTLIRCPSDGQCHHCCGTDTSNCPTATSGNITDVECAACENNVCFEANQGGICFQDGTGGRGFCNGGDCSPCLGPGATCLGIDNICCSGFCEPGIERCADPSPTTTTTTTPGPCDPPTFVRCPNGECHHCCGTDTSNCPNVSGGDAECFVCDANSQCGQIPRGAVCIIDGTSDQDGYCNGVACLPCITNTNNCSENFTCCSGFCNLADPQGPRCRELPPTTTTPLPCDPPLIRCGDSCAECCGADASNCLNDPIFSGGDLGCLTCLGNNQCATVTDTTLCTADEGGQGYCDVGVCAPCIETGPGVGVCVVGAHCCSGICDDTVCVDALTFTGATGTSACTPLTCDDLPCGNGLDDGCGGAVDCGECCEPKDVCNPGECGVIFDGCSGNIDCGPCCEPLSCAQLVIPCGIATDNCGNQIDCGPCPPETTPAPAACLVEGDRCVSDGQCCDGLCRGRGCQDRGTKICQAGCTS